MNKKDILGVAARAAGELLKDYFSHLPPILHTKSAPSDFVTTADAKSEQVILKILQNYFPNHQLYSEETGRIESTTRHCTIYIDPLDGTHNFLSGIAHFSVAIAITDHQKSIAAAVYDPIAQRLYTADKTGAFLNGKKLRISKQRSIANARIAYSQNYTIPDEEFLRTREQLIAAKAQRIYTLWSPNLDFCLLAEGRIDAIISLGLMPYDFIPGLYIAEQAGAEEIHLTNGNIICASSKKLTSELNTLPSRKFL